MAKQCTRNEPVAHPAAFPDPAPFSPMSKFASRVYALIRIAIGVVFLLSGSLKLLDHRHFSVIIEAYGLIPEAAVIPTAVALSVIELLAGLGLMWDLHGSLVLITGMLLLFVAILVYGLWMGLDVDCGCFGPQDPEAEAYHGLRPALYRDFAMLAGIGYLFFWRRIGSIRPLRLSEFNIFKR